MNFLSFIKRAVQTIGIAIDHSIRGQYVGRIERVDDDMVHSTLLMGGGIYYLSMPLKYFLEQHITLQEGTRFELYPEIQGVDVVLRLEQMDRRPIPKSFHEESKRLLAGINLG